MDIESQALKKRIHSWDLILTISWNDCHGPNSEADLRCVLVEETSEYRTELWQADPQTLIIHEYSLRRASLICIVVY